MVRKARKEEAEDNGGDEDEEEEKSSKKKTAKGKASKDDGKKKKPTPPAREEYEYDVAALAKKLDLSPFSVRVKLRDAGIKKAGRSYGWDSKKEFDKVVNQLSGD